MRKKVAMVLAVAAVLVAVAVSAVMAQSASAPAGSAPTTSKQCYSKPCYGNSNRETIYERIGDRKSDLIRAFGNYDRLHANTYSKDKDQLYGFQGKDYIYVNDTLDAAGGGSGRDWCYVDAEIEAANTCEHIIVR